MAGPKRQGAARWPSDAVSSAPDSVLRPLLLPHPLDALRPLRHRHCGAIGNELHGGNTTCPGSSPAVLASLGLTPLASKHGSRAVVSAWKPELHHTSVVTNPCPYAPSPSLAGLQSHARHRRPHLKAPVDRIVLGLPRVVLPGILWDFLAFLRTRATSKQAHRAGVQISWITDKPDACLAGRDPR